MKYKKDILIPGKLEINPFTYLEIVLNYEPYLILINSFGGYMFLKHICKFSTKLEHQTRDDIHKMDKLGLLKIIVANSNSYVLLSPMSLKYLKNKPNVSRLNEPTATQLKTSCFLAEYIKDPKDFFNSSKPYNWFLDKCKNEVEEYKIDNTSADMKFINSNAKYIKLVKEEEIKSHKLDDIFSKLRSSRVYFEKYEDGVITFVILDFERSQSWIYNTLLNKIEPILRNMAIYKLYDIKILTDNEGRKERLVNDVRNMSHSKLLFLGDIHIINLDLDIYLKSSVQKSSYLKDIDKLEIIELKEKLHIKRGV